MTTQSTPRIVLTIEEAAECLGIGRTLMYALVTAGEVESVRIGRLRRIRPTPSTATCPSCGREAYDQEPQAEQRVDHLHKLEPKHLERLYVRMMQSGSSAGTAHQAHRTIRTALNEAVRRRHISSNPASLAKAPRLVDEEVEPYTVDEVRRILNAASEMRTSAQWAVALALGLRQGKVLALRWPDLDLDTGRLIVRRSRLRPKWLHGCEKPCGRKHPGYCPQRRPAREESVDTKSRAGRRTIGLPDELVALLRKHRDEQDREREAAGQLWDDGGWVFATPTGGPTNHRTDYDEWKRLLVAAGVRDGRLHDARHTAATVGRAGTRRHGTHGLVQQCDGGPLPAHHRSGSTRRGPAGRRPVVAGRRRNRRCEMRLEVRLSWARRAHRHPVARRQSW